PGAARGDAAQRLPLRWQYLAAPVAIFILAVIMAVYFYPKLPAATAYHFTRDGTPDRWLGRPLVMVWALALQLVLALLAYTIVRGITSLNLFSRPAATAISPGKVLFFMGNIVALPQLVVGFAMLDIFSYNVYQAHLIPLWLFMLIIMGLATIGLGVFFLLIISRAIRQQIPRSHRTTKEG
ncbi:MAG: DUF1648 domain-containing protein, partial [Chloroflexota bacterium]